MDLGKPLVFIPGVYFYTNNYYQKYIDTKKASKLMEAFSFVWV
jgi:hypothetical protein